jgi:hypothetical protein
MSGGPLLSDKLHFSSVPNKKAKKIMKGCGRNGNITGNQGSSTLQQDAFKWVAVSLQGVRQLYRGSSDGTQQTDGNCGNHGEQY